MSSVVRAALLLMQLAATAAFVAPASPTSLSTRARPLAMGRCNDEGFNSFRRWPSSSTVSLTTRAAAFFGEKNELTFNEMRGLKKCASDVLDQIMDDRPMADQRGEKVLLDLEAGHKPLEAGLKWITVV